METNERIIKCLKNIGILLETDNELEDLTSFIDNSIIFITLIIELEQEFNIEIPDEYLSIERLYSGITITNMIKELTTNFENNINI